LLVFALCRLLAIDTLWTQVAVTVAALPAGVNAYLFAQRYDTGVRAATTTVFLSTLVSALTLSLLLWIFHAG
jgi:predicted permease